MVPGEQRNDAEDIYAVMQKIWAVIGPHAQVTSFNLTGYSLGGTNAAFVAKLDEDRKVFNFRKVLLLNPSVQHLQLDLEARSIPRKHSRRRRQLQQDVQPHRQSDRHRVQKVDDRVVFAGPRVRSVQGQPAARRGTGRADRHFVPAVVVGAGVHVGRDDELRFHQTREPDPDAQYEDGRLHAGELARRLHRLLPRVRVAVFRENDDREVALRTSHSCRVSYRSRTT